jgi:hypothetical protein
MTPLQNSYHHKSAEVLLEKKETTPKNTNMNSNKRRKESRAMIANPYVKSASSTKQTNTPSSTYHAHAMQATKV